MRENLLGYVLGALDGPERQQVKESLDRDPKLQQDLRALEAHLAPLENERWQFTDPPVGLAEETCELVARHQQRAPRDFTPPSPQPMASDCRVELGAGPRQYSMADMLVAAGVCVAAAMLFFPAITSSRDQARLLKCQENLCELGVGLHGYSERYAGRFPHVPPTGKLAVAGSYAVQLAEAGFLPEPTRLVCPASGFAQQHNRLYLVLAINRLRKSDGIRLIRLQRIIGGSYGYNLGYVENGILRAVRNRGRRSFGLMADAPPFNAAQPSTSGHAGGGHNVLFEDNHVRYLVDNWDADARGDDVFHNDYGLVQAGAHSEDSVIGASATPPLPRHIGIRLIPSNTQ